MKKSNFLLIIGVVIIVIGLLTLGNKIFKENIDNLSNNNFSFELIYENANNDTINVILTKDEVEDIDYNIYTYGGNVKVQIKNDFFDLREAFLLKQVHPTDIINKITNEKTEEEIVANTYLDGGTIVYKYDDYCIIKFNTLGGNKDLYISKLDFSYDKLNKNSN